MSDASAGHTTPIGMDDGPREDLMRALVVFVVAMLLMMGYVAANKWSLARATPTPAVHDEFSNLLAADTYVHGRLSNPAPALPNAFQSYHVLAQPTYASKFPPGNGLVMALGIVLAGSPIVGVWLAFALACALLTWATRPFVGRTWALAGGLGAALWLAGSTWANAYWGGALSCAGGALLLGSVKRLWDKPSWPMGLALGIALAILANTRPFEGLMVSAPLVLALIWRALRAEDVAVRRNLWRAFVPMVLVLLAAGGGMLALNAAVTGSPWRMGYTEYQRQWGWSPLFVFGTPRDRPAALFNDMQNFQGWEFSAFAAQQTLAGFLVSLKAKWGILREFYAPMGLWLPLLALPLLWRDRWVRALALLSVLVLGGAMLTVWMHPHYVSPLVAVLLVVYLRCAQRLASIGTGRLAVGRLLTVGLAAAWGTMGLQWYTDSLARSDPYFRANWVRVRSDVQEWLGAERGEHLVLVRYGSRHNFHNEWVYNGANLDGTKVLFAHDLGAAENAKLVQQYRGRTIWMVYVDGFNVPIKVGPYHND